MRVPLRLLVSTALVSTVLAASAVTVAAVPADAAPAAAHRYANCTAVHRVYSGGIAEAGTRFNTVHAHGKVTHRALKGKVKFSTALYKANKRLDRDKDGIACEKS